MTASAERSKLAAVVALLLLAAAALFVVGTSIERSTVDSENHSETPAVSATATTSSESAEGSPEHQAAEQTPSPESGEAGVETGPDTAADHARESETIAGLQLESPTATAAVAFNTLCMPGTWRWNSPSRAP